MVALLVSACGGREVPPSFTPQPSRMDPPGGPTSADSAVTIFGTRFYARGVQSLSASGGISIDGSYSAALDGVPLLDVERVSDTELRAVVPHGLPAGPHALTVTGPYGLSGTIAQGWFASDLPPAQLAASAEAPLQVSTGQTFTLLVTVSNAGGVTARGVSPSIVLGGTAAATVAALPPTQDVPGGESRTFAWSVLATQPGTLTVNGGVQGLDEVSQRPVASVPVPVQTLVQQHSALEVAPAWPAQLSFSVGQTVSLTLVVTNAGAATALGVSFGEPAGTHPALQLVSSPPAQDIPGGMTSRNFTWVYQAAQPGQTAPIDSGGAGTDENDQLSVYCGSASWPAVTIETPAQIAGAATAAPAQVTVQQTFSVALRATNVGQATAVAVTPTLRQSGTGAASVSLAPVPADIPGGASADFVWTMTATAAGSIAFSLDASAVDVNSGTTVQMTTVGTAPVIVQTPPSLSAIASATPAQASTGQPIQLELAVTNAGQATAAGLVPTDPVVNGSYARLLTGPAPQDVPGGATRSFLWTYAVDTAGSVDFSVSASGRDQNNGAAVQVPTTSSNPVTVKTAAFLEASAAVVPLQVSTGQEVTVRADVTNVGEADALAVSATATPSGTATATVVGSPVAQDIPAHATRTFSWTFQTTSAGTLGFDTSARGTDALSGTPVAVSASTAPATVQAPAALTALAQLTPAQASTGQTLTLRLDVTNGGQATAAGVTATASGGAGIATQTAAPQPQDIPGGATRSFLWTYQATASGTLQLSASASGADANSGAPVSAAPSSASSTIQTRANLGGVLRLSQAKVSVGQNPQLLLDVTNSGQAAALQFTPAAPSPNAPGTNVVASPAPADVPGGATVTFAWTLSAAAAGTVLFTVGGSATDANSSAAVPLAAVTSPQLLIQTPARLTAVARLSATQVDLGQTFQLLADVTNTGQADAAVDPGKVNLSGPGHAAIAAAPPPQTVPGGTTRTFTWTLSPDVTGATTFTVHFGGTDVNSNAAADSPPSTTPTLLIQKPAALTASIAASPAAANTGQPLTVTVTAKNAGEATAQGVAPALSIGGAGATVVSGPTPSSASITGGSSQAFTWSLHGDVVGTVTFSSTLSGTDVNTAQTVSASTPTPANVAVQTPASLSSAFASLPALVNVGQTFQLTLTVTNSGDSAANAVAPAVVLSGSGSATLSSGPAPASATIAGHTSQAFAFTYTGSAAGPIGFKGSPSGTDATDGKTVTSPSAASSTVTVQTPSAISAKLSMPMTIPLGDTFAVAFTVSNSGGASVNLAVPGNPTSVPGSTGNATLVSGPSPATATALAGLSEQTFTWSYKATAEGALQLQAQVSGTDANDGTSRAASASSAVAPIGEVVAIATNPFGDGSTFSYLADFSGQLWLGPNASGTGAVRMNADGSGAQSVQWQLEHSTAVSNTFYKNAVAHTIGSKGCTSNTAGCGPDNESGRALFFRGMVKGTEWLGVSGAHVNTGSDYARFVYFTNGGFPLASGGYTDFAYSDLSGAIASSATGLSSAAVFHDRVYLGFLDPGQAPSLEQLSTMPSLPGSGPSASVTDMGATLMPGIGGGAMIDSMAVFGPASSDGLYLANAKGFTRTTSPTPGVCQIVLLLLLDCGDWTEVTPSALAYTAKVALGTTKTSDLEPADRAVPAFATFGGRLYAARNTTTGPQIWSCDPGRTGSATQCDSGDWALVAPNTSGDAQATQFNDPNNASVTLLAATSQHLYVGFNNSVRGVVVYRTANGAAASAADFTGRFGCSASSSGCAGLGGDGLASGLTRLYDARALTLGGTEYLYLAAGTGASPVRIYRTVP